MTRVFRGLTVKVLAGLAVLAISAVAITGVGIYVIQRAERMGEEVRAADQRKYLGERLNGLVMAVVMDSRGIYMAPSTERARPFAQGLLRFLRQFEQTFEQMRPLVTPDRRDTFAELERQVRDFIRHRTETARLGTEVSPAAANEQGNNDVNRAGRQALNRAIERWVEASRLETEALDAALGRFTNEQIMFMVGLAAVLLAFGLGVSVVILRREVTKPLDRIAGAMRELSRGRTDIIVPGLGRADEIGVMAETVEIFRQNAVRLAESRQAESGRADADRAKAAATGRVVERVADVVAAARVGDFSKRAGDAGSASELTAIVSGLDEVCAASERFLGELDRVAAAMVEGDLTIRMETRLGGRFGEVEQHLNGSIEALASTLRIVRDGASQSRAASARISGVAEEFARRTEQQAANVEQMSAAIEEFSNSIRETARSVTRMGEEADAVSSEAEAGSDVAQRAVTAMGRIETGTEKVRDIVALIDSISFQTNLLALNAAVEAARAGEHGRGFAVVASEVRRLAQQCGEAARDIRHLVDGSTADVADGAKLVREAGTMLEGIIGRVRTLSRAVTEIRDTTRTQAQSVDEIAEAVGAIDKMTQDNAGSAEENAGVARAVAAEADRLASTVDGFQVEAARMERAA
jgi:methyl-accepting chemotaxis protein